MADSVRQLRKRLGPDRTARLLEHLGKGDARAFTEEALEYYDRLYDKHIANGEGTGAGGGARVGVIREVEQPRDAATIDTTLLATDMVAAVKRFEEAEAREGAGDV